MIIKDIMLNVVRCVSKEDVLEYPEYSVICYHVSGFTLYSVRLTELQVRAMAGRWRQRHMRCEVLGPLCFSGRIFAVTRFGAGTWSTQLTSFLLKGCHPQVTEYILH